MDVRLVVEKGSQRKHAFKMRGGEMILGRKKGCGIRIPSAAVSRQHCRILAADGFLTAEDLDSVLWALSWRVQPHRDVQIQRGRHTDLDPSGAPVDAPFD